MVRPLLTLFYSDGRLDEDRPERTTWRSFWPVADCCHAIRSHREVNGSNSRILVDQVYPSSKRPRVSWVGGLLQLCEDLSLCVFFGGWWYYVSIGFDPIKFYWIFTLVVIAWMASLSMEMCCMKVNDSTCAQLFFINLFKGLTLLSVGLMISKASQNYSSWTNTLIPLWIVCVMSLAVLLMLVILFVNVVFNLLKKLCAADRVGFESVKPEWNLLILSFWLLVNWSGLSISGLLFLLRFRPIMEESDQLENSSSSALFPAIFWGVVWLFTLLLRKMI